MPVRSPAPILSDLEFLNAPPILFSSSARLGPGRPSSKKILNRHPAVHLFDEVHFFERLWDDRGWPPRRPLDGRVARQAIERALDIVRRFGSGRGQWRTPPDV
jgi:hypothetical protein